MQTRSFDPIWEDIYSNGKQLNTYPFSSVASFFYRYRSRVSSPQVTFLEVGFGGGNNLWFAAREGAVVSGIEGSETAVNHAKKRFAKEGLQGDLRVGDFTDLPFADQSFDIALDRGAICCAGKSAAARAIAAIHRSLKPGGFFYSESYSDRSSSRGPMGPDGTMIPEAGPLTGIGQIQLYSASEIEMLFVSGWVIEELNHVETRYLRQEPQEVLACWHVVARKV